jgi:hypothetical protein
VRLAHLADLHLGFRQFHRQTPQGTNQREDDVAAAFRAVMDDVIAARPDLVIIAGDLFHSVRPTNPAILTSFQQLRRLRDALPDAPIVVIGGNHDTPRSVETGAILRLFEAVAGITVFVHHAGRLDFPDLDLGMLCVPHAALFQDPRPPFVPESRRSHNLLMLHGEVMGILPGDRSWLDYGGALIDPGDLHVGQWSYVALGHYHVARPLPGAPNAWYCGSTEYVSPNPWGELRDEAAQGRAGQKGWLLVDLGREARVQFRPIVLARRLIDLPAIHGAGMAPGELDEAILSRVRGLQGGIDGQMVRQLIYDVPRPVARDLSHARIREFKSRALHYHLDIRRPQPAREAGVGSPGKRQTLIELVTDYLSRRPLDATVDRERLIALARGYVEQVQARPGEA